MGEEPLQPRGHLIVVVRHRHVPVRGSLEDDDLAGNLRHLGDELRRARAGADDRDALASEVDRMVPARGVELRTAEPLEPADIGNLGPVQLADGADDGVRPQHLLAAVSPPHVDVPLGPVVVPFEERDFRVELDVLPHAELPRALAEVVQQDRLGRVVRRPVDLLGERIAVERVRNVDTSARVGVLQPRAADVVVLLEDREGDAGLLQPDAGEDPRHPGADDDDLERERRVLLPRGRARVLPLRRQLFEQQRNVVLRGRRARHPRRDAEQRLLDRKRVRRDLPVAELLQRLERHFARLRLLGRRHPALLHAGRDPGRPERFAQDREIASGLGERRQERRQERVLERFAELLVGCGERFDGAADRHRCCLLHAAGSAAVLPGKG
ncbi:MAG: hypothetical protein KatS3mg064_0402 [Tepidiforma sp.]|nr:hypothetical protein [Tepidiforma sp.]GIW17245.1 MAG: hypothetical protein KatS3mg064_0402 [Tepidiforma sp.]